MNTDREFEIWWKQKSNLPLVRSEETLARKAFLAGVELGRGATTDERNDLWLALTALYETAEAHECESFDCDRSGDTHCECLSKARKRVRDIFPNTSVSDGANNQ
jgi:hypothetical protein